MRLGDLDALKKEFIKEFYMALGQGEDSFDVIGTMAKVIDNAPTVDFEKLGKSLNCQIRASYGSCDDCELSCPRNELIKLLGLKRPKGEWVVEKNQFGDILHCSICGARPRRSEYGYDLHDKFCNECGADMRKVEE